MIRSGGESAATDLIGILIGAVGALCIWIGGQNLADPGGSVGWVQNPEGVLLWYSAEGDWVSIFDQVLDEEVADNDQLVGERVVVLVHGLDEPGGVWDDVAPALDGAGYRVARFDYPNDQAVVMSASGLHEAAGGLGQFDVERVDFVVHSMGGLVTREALTNPELGASTGKLGAVEVGRLIMVGTPNEGSGWARLRGVADTRERVQRWLSSEDMDMEILANLRQDGDGQAGIDLLPGSAFLTALNARPMPSGVAVTCIVGRVVDPDQTLMGGAVDDAARSFGDGVVSVESAILDGCEDVVMLVANHRSMIRRIELGQGWRAMVGGDESPDPEGIAIILDRLGRD
ncbi:MAG: esterase/lipase family protein [Phycisphaerales bacterium]